MKYHKDLIWDLNFFLNIFIIDVDEGLRKIRGTRYSARMQQDGIAGMYREFKLDWESNRLFDNGHYGIETY